MHQVEMEDYVHFCYFGKGGSKLKAQCSGMLLCSKLILGIQHGGRSKIVLLWLQINDVIEWLYLE